MTPKLTQAFEAEIAAADSARQVGELQSAYHHLERAHILGQYFVWPHTRCHLLFLRFGWQQRDLREMLGQIPRILLAPLGSAIRRLPRGNTGGANVNMFRSMPIPEDLRVLLEEQHR